MNVSREEVAKLADVSVATVSYVYSGKRYVSDELRSRVKDAAQQLGYYPDFIAQSMANKKTKTLAVLVSDVANPFIMQVLKGFQKAANKKGFFVNICGGEKYIESYVEAIISRRVEGVYLVVMAGDMTNRSINKMLDYGVRVVINSDWEEHDARCSCINTDYYDGMEKIIAHLSGLGHKEIIYLSCFTKEMQSDKRIDAFIKAHSKNICNNIPYIECGEPPYKSDMQTGYEMMLRVLDKNIAFTAVVCSNDLMAIGAINALNERGLKVPEDISIVGIDNIEMSRFYKPALTTLNTKSEEIGARAFENLYMNIITDKNVLDILKPELIVRDSTASPSANHNIN